MTFENDFLALMPSTVTLSTGGPAVDGYGVQTWSGAGTSYRARVVYSRANVHESVHQRSLRVGDRVVTTATVWLNSTALITTGQRVTISSASYPIMQVDSWPDEDGTHHHKLTLGIATPQGFGGRV